LKKLIPIIMIFVLAAAIFIPQQGSANSELDKINRQLAQLKKDKIAAQNKAKQAKNRIYSIQIEKKETKKSIDELNARIDEAEEELEQLNNEILTMESELEQAELEMEQAIDRVNARDQLLKSRLRLMYTNGTVSYIEVLLSSTSFTDFLDRYNSLKSLVGQDKEILESNIRDHELIIVKKGEIEEQLIELASLYTQQEETIETLWVREKQAEVAIASLNKEEEDLGEISEEQEKLAMSIIAKEAALESEKSKIETYYKGGKLRYPLPKVYRLSSNFGRRTHPITGKKGSMHNGLDFAAPNGTSILAAESGRVITAGWLGGYGNTVVIDHGGGMWTLYAHIRPNGIKVKKGQNVKRGAKIAEVGTTGNSTGYHLHFEVRLNEKAVDPKKYLNL
jgi:murein DD-endopeptidase MepM/ murein hydrolase activator NlpD